MNSQSRLLGERVVYVLRCIMLRNMQCAVWMPQVGCSCTLSICTLSIISLPFIPPMYILCSETWDLLSYPGHENDTLDSSSDSLARRRCAVRVAPQSSGSWSPHTIDFPTYVCTYIHTFIRCSSSTRGSQCHNDTRTTDIYSTLSLLEIKRRPRAARRPRLSLKSTYPYIQYTWTPKIPGADP